MVPKFADFRGKILTTDHHGRTLSFGELTMINKFTFEVTELPPRVSTDKYKEQLITMSSGANPSIADYENYSSHDRIKFIIRLSNDQSKKAHKMGLYEYFRLVSPITYATNMVLFDGHHRLRVYKSTMEIAKDHFDVRLLKYEERREFLLSQMAAKMAFISNRTRFIIEINNKKLDVLNKTKSEVVTNLKANGYISDPVRAWKVQISKEKEYFRGKTDTTEANDDYAYLLDMSIFSLTLERKDKLIKEESMLREQHELLANTSPKEMWLADLDALEKMLKKLDDNQRKVQRQSNHKMMNPSASGRYIEPVITDRMLKTINNSILASIRTEGA